MTPYDKATVHLQDSIMQAIEAVNNGGIRLALVVDDEKRLVGVVTDGDIRRAFLAYNEFSGPVENIMNSNPVVVPLGTTSSEMLNIMREHSIMHIPVVDDGRHIISVETFERLSNVKSKKTTPVFLMAGGFGTRLRPLTNSIPKVMLKVGSRPILETILLGFIEHGFSEFYISVFYLADQIFEHFGNGEKWGVNIRYVQEEQPLGTAGALSLLPETVNEPIIVMNGDLLTNVNFSHLLSFHKAKGAAATMCTREYSMEIPYGVIDSDESKIVSITEKPKQLFSVNAGIYVLSPEVVKSIPRAARKDMPDLFNELISTGQSVYNFPVNEYWLDIGRLGDFEQAQSDVLNIFRN